MRGFFSLFVCAKQELRGARYEIDLWMKNVGLGGGNGECARLGCWLCVWRVVQVCGVYCMYHKLCSVWVGDDDDDLFRVWSGD